MEEARGICEAIYDLSHTADIALLASMGIEVPQDSESDFDSSPEASMDSDAHLPCETELRQILETSKYNWFEVVQHVENYSKSACITEDQNIIAFLGTMFNSIRNTIGNPESKCQLEQSYNASVAALELQESENRIA